MKMLTAFPAVLVTLVCGAGTTGCSPQPDAPDDTVGSFCASPAEGGEFCVSAKQSPADAWNQAAAHGGLPIQMWAKWPSSLTLDQLVQSTGNLNAWYADIDAVLSHVRDQQKSAESYRASMTGNLGALLEQARDRQAALLVLPPDPIGYFKQQLTFKASTEKSPLVDAVATDKQSMNAVQAILDKAKKDAAPLSAAYASIVTAFTAYRATEAAETAAYVSLSQQASGADLATLPGVTQAVLAASKKASMARDDLTLNALKLSAQIQTFEVAEQAALAPYKDFMATHGAVMPDMTSGALRSLNAMLGYMQQRVARSDATATSLLSGIAMRTKALTLLGQGQPFRDMVAQAEMLKAAESFKAEATTRVAAFSQAPPSSAVMKLPYLAARYDELTRMVQMKPLCDPASSSWREAGCSALRPNFVAAETYLKTTLPALIATGIATMRSSGVEAMLLDVAQAKLDAGDVKGAALAYDAAVRSTEGT